MQDFHTHFIACAAFLSFDMEQSAYNDVRSKWTSLPQQMKRRCDQVTKFGGYGSYAVLQACIQMELEASDNAQTKKFQY